MLELCLKEVRLKKHITQEILAKRSGFSQSYIALLESNKRINPTLDLVGSLAKSLDVCPFELLMHNSDSCKCKD